MNGLRVAQIGNFDPPHSTENELRKAILSNGMEVSCFQEGQRDSWVKLADELPGHDFVLWTRTASELSRIPSSMQRQVIDVARQHRIPVVGYHLDIWWGLKRQRELNQVPYFKLVDIMCTADGGHQDEWASIGVEHRWFLPGVSEFECGPGTFRPEMASPVGFVGSWGGEYHSEWGHRHALVRHLGMRGDVMFWPKPGEHAVRGPGLRDLYASTSVLVGDSCGGGPRYCSDRIPETLGRGGLLIHPRTPGVTVPEVEGEVAPFVEDEHLLCWNVGDWDELDSKIEWALTNVEAAAKIRAQASAHVLEHHTYTVRIRQLVELLQREGRL